MVAIGSPVGCPVVRRGPMSRRPEERAPGRRTGIGVFTLRPFPLLVIGAATLLVPSAAVAGSIRVVNARADARPIVFAIDGSKPLEVPFGKASRRLRAGDGRHRLRIRDASGVLLRQVVVTTATDRSVTVAVGGSVGSLRLLMTVDGARVEAGGAAIRVAHLLPSTPRFTARLRRAPRAFGPRLSYGSVSPYVALDAETMARCQGWAVLDLRSTETFGEEPTINIVGEPKVVLRSAAQTLYVFPRAGGGTGYLMLADASGTAEPLAQNPLGNPDLIRLENAAPVVAKDDRATGVPARVTISPDADGRNDSATMEFAAPPGEALTPVVWYRWRATQAVWRGQTRQVPASGRIKFTWDGSFDERGKRITAIAGADGFVADGAYSFGVCRKIACLGAPDADGRGAVAVVSVRRLAASAPTRSVIAGDIVRVAVQSDRPTIRVALVPDGDTGPPLTDVVGSPPEIAIRIPPDTRAGLYRLVVTDDRGAERRPPLIVRSAEPLANPPAGAVLVVWPVLTWRAYDSGDTDRDGRADSWYEHPRERDASVSLGGPYVGPLAIAPAGSERDARNTTPFSTWLRTRPRNMQVISDIEFAAMSTEELARYAGLVFPGHTEYYIPAEYDLIHDYRARGGRVAFLLANSFYREVRLAGDRIVVDDGYARWPDRSDWALTGVGYRSCCFPGKPNPPYRATNGINRARWLFQGTGIRPGTRFGVAGAEIDDVKRNETPTRTIVLARARFREAGGRAVAASMVFTPGPLRGGTFASGNMRFLAGLDDPRRTVRGHRKVARLVENLWGWLGAGRPRSGPVRSRPGVRPGSLRIFSAVRAAGRIELRVDGRPLTRASYGEETDYVAAAAGSHAIEIRSRRGAVVARGTVALRAGEHVTLILAGTSPATARLMRLRDTRPVERTAARVRFVHAYAGGPTVDIAVPGVEQPISNLRFGEQTAYLAVPVAAFAGCFGLLAPETRAAGGETLRLSHLTVAENAAFTAIAIDPPGRGIAFKYALLRDR